MSSKIGRASTTTDAAFDEHERRMQIIEQGADRLVKDSRLFRDSVQGASASASWQLNHTTQCSHHSQVC